MSVQLHQLKYFSNIAGRLEAVTAAQIAALTPGDPIPEGATVVGQMSDALKAMLVLWRQPLAELDKLKPRALSAVTKEDHQALHKEADALIEQHEERKDLFWQAFKAELGEAGKSTPSCGFGPKFEMYVGKIDSGIRTVDLGGGVSVMVIDAAVLRR